MNILEKSLVYVALGLALIAIILALNTPSSQLGAAVPQVNCKGRAYCTAWTDIMFRNASSTDGGTIHAQNLTATGTVVLSGNPGITISGSSTISGQATARCLMIYQRGATTAASSTFYLVASSSLASDGIAGGYGVFATTTRPTICP